LLGCLLLLGACAPALQEMKEMTRTSDDFIVVVAREGETASTLAAKHLGGADRAWVITDFRDGAPVRPGDVVVIPVRPRRLGGIDPDGHQVVPILTYHDIEPVSKSRFAITVELFEQQLRYLKENGYVGITLDQLDRFLRYEQPLPKKAVVITIDDGYKSAKTYAAPLLKKYGFPATFFIYTDFIGGGKHSLSWEELRELKAQGFEVEAHSKTHSNLAVPPPNERPADRSARLDSEIVATKQLMEKRVGEKVRYFAYPYGGFDPEVVAKIKSAGYEAAFGAKKGSNPFFIDRYRLKRYSVFMEKDLTKFIKMLQTFEKD
jgi:peptidoglycan/xylan/chitin deacetylase (PgdA/CDA1 family)